MQSIKHNTELIYITRFFAAVAVVIYHFLPGDLSHMYHEYIKNWNEAVNYFFFVSGFVMIIANYRYLQSQEQFKSFSAIDFWVKRVARIYPLYLFALLGLVAFHYFIKPIQIPNIEYRLPFEILGIQRWLYGRSINFPDWTISCEFLFYFLFPYLFRFIYKKPDTYLKIICYGFLIALIINLALFFVKLRPADIQLRRLIGIVNLHPILKFPTFAIGCACGMLYMDGFFNRIDSFKKSLLVCLLSFSVIIAALYFTPVDLLFSSGLLTIVYFFFLPSICGIYISRKRQVLIKTNVFLGNISYGIYILQYPAMLFYQRLLHNIDSAIQLLYFLIFLIALSVLTYYLIEIPAKNLVLKFRKGFSLQNA